MLSALKGPGGLSRAFQHVVVFAQTKAGPLARTASIAMAKPSVPPCPVSELLAATQKQVRLQKGFFEGLRALLSPKGHEALEVLVRLTRDFEDWKGEGKNLRVLCFEGATKNTLNKEFKGGIPQIKNPSKGIWRV